MRKNLETLDADSYYASSAHHWTSQPCLSEDREVDICIIGGGMTGASAALKLAQSGVSCQILEARHVAWGAAGRSGGQLIAGQNKSLAWLSENTDPETAFKLWQCTIEGIDIIDQLCQQHSIKCDLTRGHYHVGLKPRHRDELAEMHAEHQYVGLKDSILIEGEEVRKHVNSPLYSSALYDPYSGHLHPLNYTLGLMKAALKAGAMLCEHTPVVSICETRDTPFGYKVKTEQGHYVRAKKIIIATNAYINGLEHRIEPYIMPVGTYIVATEPLEKSVCQHIIPNNSAVSDINFVLNYYRFSADQRMLFGGRVAYSAMTPLNIQNTMTQEMVKVFPKLANARIDYTWGGYVAITHNRLPHVGRINAQKDLYFSQGYSGHGVILSTVCGRILADAIMGDDHALRAFEAIKHMKFFGGKMLKKPALMLAMTYFKIRDIL